MMNKNIVIQYFLYLEDEVVRHSENKKLIFNLYQKLCEENPNKHYCIYKVQTIKEMVAKSENVRQSLMNLI